LRLAGAPGNEIAAALTAAGHDASRLDVRRVGGGCISPAARVTSADGARYFVKWADAATPGGFFHAEAESLRALAAARAVRVPTVVAVADAFLLLEWLEPGGSGVRAWRTLGHELARLHRSSASHFGWAADNYIGTLPQANGFAGDWASFWRERRLRPQLRRALEAGRLGSRDERAFAALFERLDEIVEPAVRDGPSLLHGDLWGGNVHMLADGGAALIDPASYYGHREVDLAMAALFGGFNRAFFDAYGAEWPLAPGFEAARRPLYQLYYLLVHVNLFGGAYAQQTRATLAAVVG
jgi:fructosamine-3-kinase